MTTAAPGGPTAAVALGPGTWVPAVEGELIVRLMDAYERTEGVPLNRSLRNLRAVLARSARLERGTSEPPPGPPRALSIRDPIAVADAAELLGVSREYAGRLARRGDLGATELHRGRRVISRLALAAYTHERRDVTA